MLHMVHVVTTASTVRSSMGMASAMPSTSRSGIGVFRAALLTLSTPGLGTGLVGENDAVAGDGTPVGIGSGRLERRGRGLDGLAVMTGARRR